MSTPYKLLSGLIAGVFLVVAGASVADAQSNSSAANVNLETASTAELQGVLSDLQQQVNDLFQRAIEDSRSGSGSQGESPSGDEDEDNTADIRDSNQSISGQATNFELSQPLDIESSGQEVRWVQLLLAQNFDDIYSDNLVTGFYGDLTAQAVSRLQRQGGLPETGRVDQQTLDYLQNISDSVNRDRDRDQDDDDNDESDGEQRTVTLTDGYLGAYTFTATLTRVNDTAWQYEIIGGVPNPGYSLQIITDGPEITAVVTPNEDPAITRIGSVSASGRLTVDSSTTADDLSFEVREEGATDDDDSGDDDGEGGDDEPDEDSDRESVTLTDTFFDAYGFTATLTQVDDTAWQYEITGGVPSPNYFIDQVLADGSEVIATISRRSGAAPQVVTDVQTSGQLSLESDTNADDLSFEVRDDSGSDDDASNQPPEAQDDDYAVTAGDTLDVSAAEGLLINDSDPNGDELSVDTSSVNQMSNDSGVSADFAADGSFTVQVDEDYQGDAVTYRYSASDGELSDQAQAEIDVRENEDDSDSDNSDADRILQRTVGEIEEFSADNEILIGDVNQDGSITTQDAMLIQDYVAGDADLTFRQKVAADVNGDNEITAGDVDDSDDSDDSGSNEPPNISPPPVTPDPPERLPGGVLVR